MESSGSDHWTKKMFERDAEWSKEELKDLLHWVRLVLGLILGIVWGVTGQEGGQAGWTFVALNAGFTISYLRFLGIEDDVMPAGASLMEGMMPSYALFTVCWVITYSAMNGY